jgi:hypothetical protein
MFLEVVIAALLIFLYGQLVYFWAETVFNILFSMTQKSIALEKKRRANKKETNDISYSHFYNRDERYFVSNNDEEENNTPPHKYSIL